MATRETTDQLIAREQAARAAAERYAAQLRGLTDAAVVVSSALSLEQILQVLTDEARALIGAHQAITSMTVNRNWAQAITTASLSERYAAFRGYNAPPSGSGIYSMVCETNRPVRMTQAELERHPRWRGFGKEAGAHPPMRGWLAAPLVARDGTNLGLLQLSDKYAGEFTEEDLSILVQLARMASIAIENARLVERVEAALEDAEAARRLAESANQAKSDFLTIMSHELRTPLNAIGGYVQLLELGVRGPMTEAQLTDLARIRRNQEHLLGLINNVLNFAKLDAGRVHFHIVDARVDEVCADFEAMIAPQIRAKRLCYTLHQPDPTLVMRADPEKVRQIVLNLLTNAIKFTPAGGRIDIACEGSAGSVCIHVTDTGTGIPADRLDAIFDPFVQVHTRLTRTTEGVGLGLAISRELARSMEGDLTVTSGLGAGSTFTLRVPRRTADVRHAWDLGHPA